MKEFPFLLYKTEKEDISINALIKDDSIWLTQKAMAELFGIDKSGISRHLANIFETGELDEEVVVAKIATTTQHGAIEGKTQSNSTNFYNLDAIISVGYRVNSIRATHFRIWATNVLKEYMTKGFVLDDERLKQRLVKIILKNYSKEFVLFVRAKEESGNRLRMFLLSVALIMIKMRRLHISFMQWCRINSIMQFRDRQQQKLFIIVQTI